MLWGNTAFSCQDIFQHLVSASTLWCPKFKIHKSVVPNLFGTRYKFHWRQYFHGQGRGWRERAGGAGQGDGFRMIQVHHIYCAIYFYSYHISSTSDHQALDLGGWGPLLYMMPCQWASQKPQFNHSYCSISYPIDRSGNFIDKVAIYW